MSAGRLSVVQQVHHQEAPTGGAVHVLCPPLQAGNSMKQPLCAVRPVTQPRTQPGPASNIPVFYPDNSEIENLNVPPVTGWTHTHTQPAPWQLCWCNLSSASQSEFQTTS